jgi:hypothetical protein
MCYIAPDGALGNVEVIEAINIQSLRDYRDRVSIKFLNNFQR